MRQAIQPIVLNGSHGEGGGALFRTAILMSAHTQQPVRVHRIRGAMRKPGLNSEDLTFLAAVSASCRAQVQGDDLNSDDLSFAPSQMPRGITQKLDVGSHEQGLVPGNALTIAESLVPLLARTGTYSSLTVTGETHNNNTITYDAFERVILAAHRQQGLHAFPSLISAGFGFGGRGEVVVEIEPSALQGLSWRDRGERRHLGACLVHNGIPEGVVNQAAKHLNQRLGSLGLEAQVEEIQVRSRQTGMAVTVWAEFEQGLGSGSAAMHRNLQPQSAVDRAVDSFLAWYGTSATTDPFLADQLLIPAVLADERTEFTTSQITRRLVTMAFVIKQFLPIRLTILGREGEPGTITVER